MKKYLFLKTVCLLTGFLLIFQIIFTVSAQSGSSELTNTKIEMNIDKTIGTYGYLSAFNFGNISPAYFLTFEENSKYGLINTEGKILLPAEFESHDLYILSDKYAYYIKNGYRTVIGKEGNEISSIEDNSGFLYVFDDENGVFSSFDTGMDNCGIYEGYYIGSDVDDTSNFFKSDKDVTIYAYSDNNDTYMARLNLKNLTITGEKYDSVYVSKYNKSLFIVGKDGKYGIMDEDGTIIIPLVYDSIGDHTAVEISSGSDYNVYDNAIKAEKDGKYGIIDKNNNIIVDFIYDGIDIILENGYYSAQQNGKYGVFNINGTGVTGFDYDMVLPEENYIGVVQDKKIGVIDYDGNIAIPIEHEVISHEYSFGIIPYNYYEVYEYENEPYIFIINADERYDVYGKNGYVESINTVYHRFADKEDADSALKDYVMVQNSSTNKFGLYDTDGNSVLEPKYDNISYFDKYNGNIILQLMADGTNELYNLNENKKIISGGYFEVVNDMYALINSYQTALYDKDMNYLGEIDMRLEHINGDVYMAYDFDTYKLLKISFSEKQIEQTDNSSVSPSSVFNSSSQPEEPSDNYTPIIFAVSGIVILGILVVVFKIKTKKG